MRRRTFIATTAALPLSAVISLQPLPAEAKSAREKVTEQIQFLAGRQLPDGAILTFDDRINPYFANIACLGLLATRRPEAHRIVLGWMQWHLAHLETSDASGLNGTIYDYGHDSATGTQTPTGDYDSVDSYASTALNLAHRAHRSGDRELRTLVRDHWSDYERIAALLINSPADGGVREGLGLTIAKPSYPILYAMDNAEVVSGLRDHARLGRRLRSSTWRTHRDAAEQTRRAMLEHLWDAGTGTWHWAVGNPSNPAANFYPQAAAQIWPILFGVVHPHEEIARQNWRTFTSAWPTWVDDDVPDAFPWTSMAVVAHRMGDWIGERRLLNAIDRKYAPGWHLPTHCGVDVCGRWYSAEAGWMLLALTRSRP